MTKDNDKKGKSVVFDGETSEAPRQSKGNVDRMGLDRYSTISRAPRDFRIDLKNTTALDIPKEVENEFGALGWNLYWAKTVDQKTKRGTNERINYFKAMGGQLVSPAMLLEMAGTIPQARDLLRRLTSQNYRESFAESFDAELNDTAPLEETALSQDGMVLMMIPKVIREQKQKQIAKEQQERMAVTQRRYKENTGDGTVSVEFKSSLLNKASDVFG